MAPSPTLRRLLKETAELSSSSPHPTPAFYAAPVSDSDLHEWHFILLGPPAPSPYAGGLYHGRITLPPTYPLKPPNFRFLTPSGRFEVNREICLSISGFHEETWMPAWGVRTALTALRTFMAEPGTAGQVGGLEAPEAVRKRLAGESRRWRCGAEGCGGGRTNEEMMREWWEVCRGKGVKVDEEGEAVGLEVLPEGMNVEAREVGKGKEKEKETQQADSTAESSQPQPAPSIPQSSTTQPPQQAPLQAQTPQLSHPQPQSQLPTLASPPAIPNPDRNPTHSAYFSPTPTPEQSQRAAEAHLTPSELSTTTSQRPMMNLHRPPLAVASAALADHAALQRIDDGQAPTQTDQQAANGPAQQHTPTIDRAIAAIFLMLVVMVLKKIFFPSAGLVPGLDGLSGATQGGGMEREL